MFALGETTALQVSFESASVLQRPQALRRVARWPVDEPGDLVHEEVSVRKCNEEPTKLSLARLGIEPSITHTRRQDHQHPACGQGDPFSPCLIAQIPAKAEGLSRLEWMKKRRPPTSVVPSPLLKAVCHDEAVMASEGVPEHR